MFDISQIDTPISIFATAKNAGKEIFIRLATKKEIDSPTEKKRAFLSFPEKSGFEVVYKTYGEQGRGFYYTEK